ncbi:MAG: hypothetical protein KA712_05800 [Myxococcales bacterium]|nr:hypothetical protein [Myxococcales bacterium]
MYRGSRTAVTALLAGAVACIGSYGILRFGVQVLHAQLALGRPVLLVLGGASALYGGIAAISQRTTSGVLAYSSVAQAGFIWLAVGIGGVAGYTAAIVYALTNALNKGLGFLAAPNDKRMVKVSFAIAAFSITGLPPTLGFWAKFSLFESGWLAGALVTSVVLMAASALSFLYVYPAYQRGAWRDSPVAPALPLAQRAVTWGLVALVLGLGLWPAPLYAFAARGARELMEGRGP